MKKMRKVALRENKMQIATGQRENPETVAVSGFLVAETGLEPATSGL